MHASMHESVFVLPRELQFHKQHMSPRLGTMYHHNTGWGLCNKALAQNKTTERVLSLDSTCKCCQIKVDTEPVLWVAKWMPSWSTDRWFWRDTRQVWSHHSAGMGSVQQPDNQCRSIWGTSSSPELLRDLADLRCEHWPNPLSCPGGRVLEFRVQAICHEGVQKRG